MARGIVGASEADRLRFASAAEHALAVGEANPPGLFWYLIRGARWRYLTQADEDAARRRLREHRHGRPAPSDRPKPVPVPTLSKASGLSDDARLVREVRAATIRAGIFRDPWPAFQARNPTWDRGRWDAALAELGLS